MKEEQRGPEQNRLVSLNSIVETLKTAEAVSFLTKLVFDAFTVLRETIKSPTPTTALESAAEVIYKDIFRKEAPDFWFTSVHHRYKTEEKPRKVIPVLASYLKGNKVLDVGGGSGYLSMGLQRAGYSAALTDVLDYRAEETQSLPFKLMTSPTQLPYDDNQFVKPQPGRLPR